MVKDTHIDNLREKLRDIFCAENKANKKYSQVWFSDVDFGGIYRNNKFVLNVKAEHEIDSCNDEIKYVVNTLFKKLAKEDVGLIWRVVVYNSSEEVHCASGDGDMLIYDENDDCA